MSPPSFDAIRGYGSFSQGEGTIKSLCAQTHIVAAAIGQTALLLLFDERRRRIDKIRAITGHVGAITAMSLVGPWRLATASSDRTVRLHYCADDSAESVIVRPRLGSLCALAVSRDATLIAVSGWYNTVKVRPVSEHEQSCTLNALFIGLFHRKAGCSAVFFFTTKPASQPVISSRTFVSMRSTCRMFRWQGCLLSSLKGLGVFVRQNREERQKGRRTVCRAISQSIPF